MLTAVPHLALPLFWQVMLTELSIEAETGEVAGALGWALPLLSLPLLAANALLFLAHYLEHCPPALFTAWSARRRSGSA